jgi:hypothetical protein
MDIREHAIAYGVAIATLKTTLELHRIEIESDFELHNKLKSSIEYLEKQSKYLMDFYRVIKNAYLIGKYGRVIDNNLLTKSDTETINEVYETIEQKFKGINNNKF